MFPITEDQEILQQTEDKDKELQDQNDNDLLYKLVRMAEMEDEDIRYRLIRNAKRNEFYFNNLQKFYFDEVARDYRSLEAVVTELASVSGSAELEDIKIPNVYRAYAESLIAALSIQPPNTEFTPDDSEDPDDIETAEAYSRIAELISRHNQAQLLLVKALVILFNQGVVFGYNFYKTDPAYGVVTRPKETRTVDKTTFNSYCPECNQLAASGLEQNQVNQPIQCPECGFTGLTNLLSPQIEQVQEVVSWEDTPKGRSGFDVFGLTNVKVSIYARNQESCGYLILRIEDNVAKFKEVYSEFADKITPSGGDTYLYERWGRVPLEYSGQIFKDITTLRTCWLRPWYFNNLQPEEAEYLKGKYPKGVMVSVIGEQVVEKQEEKLDDRWTITFDPRANFIHGEPAGNALTPLQDAETDVFNLGLQSIEYGIPETFANPKTLNFKKYKESRATPGMVTPALPPGPDKNISDGFHTIKTATLSSEYMNFERGLEAKTQFVTGAFPSVFGGTNLQGGQTATEYTESRARALQRLQLVWQMMSSFWRKLITKCVVDFAQNLREDERFAKKQNGTYINVWVRTSQLKGKVGHVEPELDPQLPQSWAQIKDTLMQVLNLQIPEVGQILLHPSNTEILKRAMGVRDFYIPGECDRNKQFSEYYELAAGQPLDEKTSSVPIDIVVDDHQVHMLVLKGILVDSVGLQLYKTNPAAYQNCILHYRAHEMALQAKMMSIAGPTMPGEPPESAAVSKEG
jgi:hypothetical protein